MEQEARAKAHKRLTARPKGTAACGGLTPFSVMPGMHRRKRIRTFVQAAAPMGMATFTPEEFAKLAALRTRLQHRIVDIELGLDERRLGFARWPVEHRMLSEDLASA